MSREDNNNQAMTEALFRAIGRDDIQEVARLLQGGADVNGVRDDQTPLHHAAAEGHADIVVLLLGAGANVDAQTAAGHTPITLALGMAQWSTDWKTIMQNINRGEIGDMDAGGYPGVIANLVQTGANLALSSAQESHVSRGVRRRLIRIQENAPHLMK